MPCVGIDIGTESLKLIEIEPSGEKRPIKTIRYHVLEFENLAQAPPEEKRNLIAKELQELLSLAKKKKAYAATNISGSAVIVREAKMPKLIPAELKQVLPFEAEPFIPYNIQEVNLDYHATGETEVNGEKKYDGILVAAKQDAIDEHLNLLTQSGVNPIIVDVDAFALANFIGLDPDNQKQTIMIANIGATNTNLAIIEKGVIKVARDVAIAGNTLTHSIEEAMSIPWKKAEDLKKNLDLEGPPADEEEARAKDALQAVVKELLAELHKSLDFFLARGPERSVHKIYLSGGGALLKNLAPFTVNELKFPVEVFNPFSVFQLPNDAQAFHNLGPIFTVACGLALRSWGDWLEA